MAATGVVAGAGEGAEVMAAGAVASGAGALGEQAATSAAPNTGVMAMKRLRVGFGVISTSIKVRMLPLAQPPYCALSHSSFLTPSLAVATLLRRKVVQKMSNWAGDDVGLVSSIGRELVFLGRVDFAVDKKGVSSGGSSG